MNARQYLDTVGSEGIKNFCKAAGTSVVYFRLVANRHKKVSLKQAIKLAKVSAEMAAPGSDAFMTAPELLFDDAAKCPCCNQAIRAGA